MSSCKFCKRKLTPFRKRGRLEYHAIYARDPSIGYLVCVDCLDALEKSIKSIREEEPDD